jgi:D-alanyl-D-alanine carboxypeptidase/D-alanyl-D-alanine-endopeptidase (penicillin-binding protein 4)
MSSRSSTLAAALLVATAACHAAPKPATAPRLAAVQQLQRDLDAVLAAPALEHSFWGVLVRSLARDDTLYRVNAQKLFMPASNMKIVTLSATAERLGWDFRYETQLRAAGPIDDGTLAGDLLVVGSGDPSIGGRDRPPTRVFDTWADELKAKGLRRIDGRVVGDDHSFDNERLGAGWTWDDLDAGYSAGVSALQFNENSVRATIAPGIAAGDEAIVTVDPPGSGLTIDNRVVTGAAAATMSVSTRRLAGSTRLELRGTMPLGHAPDVQTLSVDNPTQFFATVLRSTLIAHGIDVRGPAVDIDDVSDAPRRDATSVLITYQSPTLAALATTLMKVSQNLYAETFLKTIGARAGTPTFAGGRAVARATLEPWGVSDGGLIMRDGSGLSRYNYVSPETLVTILTHVDRDARLRDPFESALPVGGRDGTLARRLAGTAADGKVHAKTGSISNARALSGFVTTADGERLVFSILTNSFEVPANVVEHAADAIVVRLATFSRR